MHNYTIFEVLEYGPIVAWDKDSGYIITCGKAAFSAWVCTSNGKFTGTNTCLVAEIEKVGNCTDFGIVCEVADEWLHELLADCEPEEPSN